VTYRTGLSFEIPEGYVGLVWPRSGLSIKEGVDVLAGVVDSGYRGEVMVCLLNTGVRYVKIKEGDRIAQILFQEVPEFQLQEVEILQNSDRGEGGFGSSGK
jgi:dUTP pyrophosphatase